MLSPDEVEALGSETGRIASESADAVLVLVESEVASAIRSGSHMGDLDVTGLTNEALAEIGARYPRLSQAARREVAEAVASDLSDDLSRMSSKLDDLDPITRSWLGASTESTIQGTLEIIRRDNLSMATDARQVYYSTLSKYLPQVTSGRMTYEDAVRDSTIELADRGIKVIDYASKQTADADVAMRRHVRTQVVQDGQRRVSQVMDDLGWDLVETSSHYGARPSHRPWQGHVFSRSGSSTKYPDLVSSTGYGTVGGLCGANCRHSFGPWQEGTDRSYSPTPDEDAGLDPDDVYKATQRQRYLERKVRQTKRRAAGLEAQGLDNSVERIRLGRYQEKLRQHVASNSDVLARDYTRERAAETSMVYPLANGR